MRLILLVGLLSASTCVGGGDDSLNPYNWEHDTCLEHINLYGVQLACQKITFLHACRLYGYLALSKSAKLPNLSS